VNRYMEFSANEWEELKNQLQGIAINKDYLSSALAGAVSKWVFGLRGPWQMIVATILVEIISQCSDPDKQAVAILNEAMARDSSILPDLKPLKSIRLPEGIERAGGKLIPSSVKVSSPGNTKDPGVDIKLLIIPFDQTVNVKWSIWGHAAICKEDIARVEIFANKDGNIYRPFAMEAHGVSRFPNPETVASSGTRQLQLTAGGYIVRMLQTGNFSGGSMTVEYNDIQIPTLKKLPWLDYIIIGTGAGCIIGGAYLISKEW